jgi:hypothetical protein
MFWEGTLETRDYALIKQASANRLFDLVDRLVRSESKERYKGKFSGNKKRIHLRQEKFNSNLRRTLRNKAVTRRGRM